MRIAQDQIKSSVIRTAQHLVFWALSYYLLLRIFSTGSDYPHRIDFYYTAIFHLPLITAVYINLHLLIPRLLAKDQKLVYFLAAIALIAFASILDVWFFDHAADELFAGFYFISYYGFWDMAQFFLVYVSVSTLLRLSRGWFQLTKTERALAQANQEKLEAELKALKSQINPHFLFNSLNSLYALARKKDQKAPDAILKLSDAMRFILYECNADLVPLSSELSFLSNYVDLQKLRSKDEGQILFELQGDPSDLKIAPMILVPFIENGFKHGVKGDLINGFIRIKMKIDNSEFQFDVTNNIGEVDELVTTETGGIGLPNVKQRLSLLYPMRHQLDIEKTENQFSVSLKLQLS